MPTPDGSKREVSHHAARLTDKVIDDDTFRMLDVWIDGFDDDEDVEELVNRIYSAVSDEIEETLNREGYEADMDDRELAYSVGDSL